MPVISARLPFMRRSSLASPQPAPDVAPVLAREADHEARVVARVTPPQPARLVREAECPLESESLEAIGRLAHQSGVEVEGGADANEDCRVKTCAHRSHPFLL